MRYLIFLLLLTGCVKTEPITEPKFMFRQQVVYKVPHYFLLVCSGKGRAITEVQETRHGFYYNIAPPLNEGFCDPGWIAEKDIEAAK